MNKIIIDREGDHFLPHKGGDKRKLSVVPTRNH